MIRFVIPGKPVPWKASTIVRRPNSKRGWAGIKDAGLENYQALVALAAQQAMAGRAPFAKGIPLHLRIQVELPVPDSWSQRKRLAALDGRVLPTGRPDLTNYLKSVEDGCNGIVWADDSANVTIAARKSYGLRPGMAVEVIPITTVEGA